ncbi:hypothetical protein GRJ2_003077200 [Grus japonensis]|uniref:Uncharacterized protein n=1 Tax=Grus japonensis TaxID=30415 RepID=A0ABC9Y980_GRUJA
MEGVKSVYRTKSQQQISPPLSYVLSDNGVDVRHAPRCALAVRPLHDWQNADGTLRTKWLVNAKKRNIHKTALLMVSVQEVDGMKM